MSNVRLSEAAQQYVYFRMSDGIAENTRYGEQGTLRQFKETTGDLQLASIREHHMTAYFASRSEAGIAASTQRLDMTRLNTFFRWARATRRMPRDLDPLAGRRGPRVVRKERRRVHVSKWPHLLDVAEQRCPRDRMLVALALYTMLRDQEMLTIRLRDVDLDAGVIFVKVHKSADEDSFGISPALDAELRKWLKHYQEMSGQLQPDWCLIPARKSQMVKGVIGTNGGKLEYFPTKKLHRSFTVIQPVLINAGFALEDGDGKSTREGAHTLRRSGARAFYDLMVQRGSVDALNMTRVALHHADVKQTMHYIGLKEDRKTRNDLLHEVRYPFEAENVAAFERKSG